MIFAHDTIIVLFLSVTLSFCGGGTAVEARPAKYSSGLNRMLLDHQSKFDQMRFRIKNKGRQLDEEEVGGCIRSTVGDLTSTLCIDPQGDFSSCVVDNTDNSCEYMLLQFSRLQNLAAESGPNGVPSDGLGAFFNDAICDCENETPDCSRADPNYSENTCTVVPGFSFDCDEDAQCCRIESNFEGEPTTVECCITTDENSNSVESECCVTTDRDGKICSGSSVSCPDGVGDDGFDYTTCSCSMKYQGDECGSCEFCVSDDASSSMDNGIAFDCENRVEGWKLTCDESDPLDLAAFSRNGDNAIPGTGGGIPEVSKLFLFPGVERASTTDGSNSASTTNGSSSAISYNQKVPIGARTLFVSVILGLVAVL